MKVVGFAGYSGAGKTTLVEQLVARLKACGLRVAVIKHAHHDFAIDKPGKDSWRHRQAGASEVLLASSRRLALMREFDEPTVPDVHALLTQLDPRTDWVLVEGFKDSTLPKIEVWRAAAADEPPRPVRHPHDPYVLAVATDAPHRLPQPTMRPVLDLNHADAVLAHLVHNQHAFKYTPPAP